jgi:hypothetical protein
MKWSLLCVLLLGAAAWGYAGFNGRPTLVRPVRTSP